VRSFSGRLVPVLSPSFWSIVNRNPPNKALHSDAANRVAIQANPEELLDLNAKDSGMIRWTKEKSKKG